MNIYRLKLVQMIVVLLAANGAIVHAAKAPRSSKKVTITIKEKEGIARGRELVVIAGSQIQDVLPDMKIDTRLIQVMHRGKLVPTQIDQRDNRDNYTLTPNNILDANDEICFQVSIEANASDDYTLVLNHVAQASESVPTDLTYELFDTMTPQAPYNVYIKNSRLAFGVARTEKSENPREQWKAWHGGSISFLKNERNSFFRFSRPNSHFPAARIWPSLAKKPQVVCQGPVRIIVQSEFELVKELAWHLEKNWARNGQLKKARRIHTFTLTSGSNAIDFAVEITFDQAGNYPFRECWQYNNAFIGTQGIQPDQMVYWSKNDQLKTARVDDLKEALADGTFVKHASLGDNQDGWIAQYDPTSEAGLAIFGSPKVQQIRSSFFKGAAFGNRNYPASFYILYNLKKVPEKKIVRHYRLQVLENETPSQVMQARTAYHHRLAIVIHSQK